MIPIGNARGGLYGVVGSGSFALLRNVGAWKSHDKCVVTPSSVVITLRSIATKQGARVAQAHAQRV